MAEEASAAPAEAKRPATPAARTRPARSRRPSSPPAESAETPPKPSGPRAENRPTLPTATARLLAYRDAEDARRPRFTRQASYRYWRIGRDGTWRRPRGQQSKQRRHYGYRSTVVSIGFRSPRAVRGLTPTGFRPVLVRTPEQIAALDRERDAAVIGRTVGTRRRLVLEEAARKRGVKVLNPIRPPEAEE